VVSIDWEIPKLMPSQRELLFWNPPEGTKRAITGSLSISFGTGKTTAAALRFVRTVLEHPPWDPSDRLRQQPCALAIAPTYPLLRFKVLPLLEWAFPPGTILRTIKTPPQVWYTINGVKVWLMSAEGLVDSGDVFCIFADEISYPQFLDSLTYRKIMGRLRYPCKYREMIVSGIASSNPIVKERYDHPDDPTFKIVLPGLKEAPIDEQARADILSTVAFENRDAALEGGSWAPEKELIYSLDPTYNRVDNPVDKSYPSFVAIDPGTSSSAIVVQNHDGCLVVVDEWVGDDQTTDALCLSIKAMGYNIQGVAVDTQAHIDAVKYIRSVWPSATVFQAKKKTVDWYVESGIEKVKIALRDATGGVKLKFHGKLWDNPCDPRRGVIKSLSTYRRASNGKPSRDNVVDHQCDVVRYAVVHFLPENTPVQKKTGKVGRLR
jgi:hypothetical protein